MVKKGLWPHVALYVGAYSENNDKIAKVGGETLQVCHFSEERFKCHDLLDVVDKHYKMV